MIILIKPFGNSLNKICKLVNIKAKLLALLKNFSSTIILIIGTAILISCIYIFYPDFMYCRKIKPYLYVFILSALVVILLENIILNYYYKLSYNSNRKISSSIPLFQMLFFFIQFSSTQYIKDSPIHIFSNVYILNSDTITGTFLLHVATNI